ncbi:hypothetical protein EDC18_11515 [Natranaerovirga pectinivora]|uniref:NfeD-like partner-binding protein n=1 Tax=Natranaerovirga pectinivora TaxID=682400 RepID=A0A4R3MDF6_9FIRM|nr:NfeD family protein [Natranaerovirga pectinivora]TCT11670.1 hypothetical protein EDC18_11515 [Natranaerovirga pectinivora]
MQPWWESLDALQKFLYIIAFASTFILLIQSLFSVFGLDQDFEYDGGIDDFSADFQFFSIRGMIAFFTLFGWTGALLSQTPLSRFLIMTIALVAGLIGMVLVAFLFYSMTKLQQDGTFNYEYCVGQIGEVYLPIPGKRAFKGKIVITIHDRSIEADAITDEDETLSTGSIVKVIAVVNQSTLVVERN